MKLQLNPVSIGLQFFGERNDETLFILINSRATTLIDTAFKSIADNPVET